MIFQNQNNLSKPNGKVVDYVDKILNWVEIVSKLN